MTASPHESMEDTMPGEKAIIFRSDPSEPLRTGPDGAVTHVLTAPTPAAAAALAAKYVERGVDTVELCGATGYPWAAAVQAAVGGRARVGTVLFGFESLLDVADYKRRASAGEALRELFLYVQPGADPAVDRFVRSEGASTSQFVAVPEAAAGAAVAAEFADGIQLIELYGAWEAGDVAAVIEAVGERVPVGVVSYPTPSPAARPAA
ncbi:DUF6506 family protein [Streptomyces sp. NPDC048057]|uniref:DUF6506 family protein n=1 Tax=Streptomyces sp. NPDC048057 TaxID=3155628 RepID=UPI0033DE93F2